MSIESPRDLIGLARAGRVVSTALREMKKRVQPGITTADLDAVAAQVLERYGARSAPRAFYGFPGTACISVNDEAVHGVPGTRKLSPGDLVKLDVTVELGGYIADAAITVAVPPASDQARRLSECARVALNRAMGVASSGTPINQIGKAVESRVRGRGFTVIRELAGHGVGRAIHEEPSVPNYYVPGFRECLTEGLVITIEPIISAGSRKVQTGPDGWTVKTTDGSLSAHFEHTIVITRDRPIVLTAA